jgi:hypothetical protein
MIVVATGPPHDGARHCKTTAPQQERLLSPCLDWQPLHSITLRASTLDLDEGDPRAELRSLRRRCAEQRKVIESQRETLRLMTREARLAEELGVMEKALQSKDIVVQLMAATPVCEMRSI